MSVSERCPEVCKLFNWQCELPEAHGGEHVRTTEYERVTWKPRSDQQPQAVEHERTLAEFAEWVRRGQSLPCPVAREHVDAAINAIEGRP